MTSPAVQSAPHPGVGFKEFVALIAAIMALNALSIDAMLPALPAIGEALGVVSENQRQWVVTAYLLGFGVTQIIYGPLADRYGRKPVLMVGVTLYVAFSVVAAFANSFEWLLLARIGQGVGAAALRVLAVSIVRDCYSGRTMARVMSLTFLVFLGVPIIAPSLGQMVLLVAPWPAIFGVLGGAGAALALWVALRMPETLHADDRMKIEPARILGAFREAVTNRQAIGYTLAMTAITSALFGFINSSQQIFFDVFEQPGLFGVVFAAIAGSIAVASLLNSALVVRLGTRRLSHLALIGFTLTGAVHTVVAVAGYETLVTFALLQAINMFFFGFIAGNFGSMAMEPMGHIAGTASSAQGFISTTLGALGGFAIGQMFNGTTVPLSMGMMSAGLVAFVFVLIAERGRLFVARNVVPGTPGG
jgi:DHA1 family bicyclomycin/chloramphenicol resistance-like MFS transporter